MLASKDRSRVRVVSRRGVDHTTRFPVLATAIGKLRPFATLIDDEQPGAEDPRV